MKISKMLRFNNKKGVSIIIGYVLLIAFAVIMGAVVYSGLRTYVPTETVECPDGVSLFVQDSNYCGNQLNLTIRNNGRFNVAGYYILASNSLEQEQATLDISPYINRNFYGRDWKNAIMFSSLEENSFNPGNQTTNVFEIPVSKGTIYSVNIIPARFQAQDNKERFARCANVKIVEKDLNCLEELPECVPECTGKVCGSNGCGGTCGSCVYPQVCNAVGQCTLTCTDTCLSLGYECETQTVCGISTDCGTCGSGLECNAAGQCESIGPTTLFYDDFESYTATGGLTLYSQMNAQDWTIIDAHEIKNDDIYLNNTFEYAGAYSVVVRDNSEIIVNISTTGYQSINLSYYGRTYSMPSNSYLRTYWRIGNSGSWTSLDNIHSDTWSQKQWALTGAENKLLIQVRFLSDSSGNNDYSLIDNVNVTGMSI